MFYLVLVNPKQKKKYHSKKQHKKKKKKYITKNIGHNKGETGPEHWQEIEKKSDCNGKSQSPINIIETEVIEDLNLKPINFHYTDKINIHDLTNNGHSIQYNFDKGDYLEVNNKRYDLAQLHFHEPSEHTINGIRYPIEIHFVHVNKKDHSILVLALLGKEGNNNTFFNFLESYLPIAIGETKAVNSSFNLKQSLPSNQSYYHYNGSLTTPPCSEGVNWYVLKNPITLSVEQVKKLQELMPTNNYRTEQAKNGRMVKVMVKTN